MFADILDWIKKLFRAKNSLYDVQNYNHFQEDWDLIAVFSSMTKVSPLTIVYAFVAVFMLVSSVIVVPHDVASMVSCLVSESQQDLDYRYQSIVDNKLDQIDTVFNKNTVVIYDIDKEPTNGAYVVPITYMNKIVDALSENHIYSGIIHNHVIAMTMDTIYSYNWHNDHNDNVDAICHPLNVDHMHNGYIDVDLVRTNKAHFMMDAGVELDENEQNDVRYQYIPFVVPLKDYTTLMRTATNKLVYRDIENNPSTSKKIDVINYKHLYVTEIIETEEGTSMSLDAITGVQPCISYVKSRDSLTEYRKHIDIDVDADVKGDRGSANRGIQSSLNINNGFPMVNPIIVDTTNLRHLLHEDTQSPEVVSVAKMIMAYSQAGRQSTASTQPNQPLDGYLKISSIYKSTVIDEAGRTLTFQTTLTIEAPNMANVGFLFDDPTTADSDTDVVYKRLVTTQSFNSYASMLSNICLLYGSNDDAQTPSLTKRGNAETHTPKDAQSVIQLDYDCKVNSVGVSHIINNLYATKLIREDIDSSKAYSSISYYKNNDSTLLVI